MKLPQRTHNSSVRSHVKEAVNKIRRFVLPRNKQDLPRLYRELHANGLFVGLTWKNSYDLFAASIPNLSQYRILDFGCGPRGGLAETLGESRVVSYDPYVDRYSKPPWDKAFDVVFSSDVLEHLPYEEIGRFSENVAKSQPKFIFLNISTRAADKTFSNGANVHVTVKPSSWWIDTLNENWGRDYSYALLRDEKDECTLLFRLNHVG